MQKIGLYVFSANDKEWLKDKPFQVEEVRNLHERRMRVQNFDSFQLPKDDVSKYFQRAQRKYFSLIQYLLFKVSPG